MSSYVLPVFDRQPERLLVVSPHLDDGILSVGGSLAMVAKCGSTVRLATIFSGSSSGPLSTAARAFHSRCQLGDNAMGLRLIEDHEACQSLGVDPWYGGLPEALYRLDEQGRHRYPDGQAIFNADPRGEPAMISTVERKLQELLAAFQPDLVMAPLAVGGHVDHAITRLAVLGIGLESTRVRWFEDLPYALYQHLRGWEPALTSDLRACPVNLNERAWTSKITAVGHYASQLDVLWYETTPWPTQLRDYATALGDGRLVERLWLA